MDRRDTGTAEIHLKFAHRAPIELRLLTLEGKGEAALSLPVVANRLIPVIYRRASFSHRATPIGLPLSRGLADSQTPEPRNH